MKGSLGGLRVVDTGEGTAAGYCTRMLAGLGADVIKLEQPRCGDRLRRQGPFAGDVPHPETSIPHLHLNASKRSVTLDASTRSGARIAHQLLERADVVIVDERLARSEPMSPRAIETRHPHLIVAAISPFGLDAGAFTEADRDEPSRGSDIVELAWGGYLAMTGDSDREPVKPYGEQAHYQAGLHAAVGILSAVAARDGNGAGGQRVDVAATEAATFLVGGALQRWHFFGREARRDGSRTIGMAPNFLYPSTILPCDSGYVHVHVHNRFPDLLAALTGDERLADPDLQVEPRGHADEIDAMLTPWLQQRDKWTCVAEAQELRVPFAEVLDPAEIVGDPFGQLAARGALPSIAHPVAGAVRQPGGPIVMPASPWDARRAPLLGEHNSDVLRGELGLSGRELNALAASGVI